MTRLHRNAIGLLVAVALASESFGQEREGRTAGRDRSRPAATTNIRRSRAANSAASKKLTSYQAQSLVRLPYRENFTPTEVGQGGAENDASDDLNIVTTVYGGASGPFVANHYSQGAYGRMGNPPGLASFSFSFPYAYGRLATSNSYGVYGYPYYSFYRPSYAYSIWGWPGISPLGNFGYGGYGLPYGYYGMGAYNYPYGFGGIGFPTAYSYGYGVLRNRYRYPRLRVSLFPRWGYGYGYGGLGMPYGGYGLGAYPTGFGGFGFPYGYPNGYGFPGMNMPMSPYLGNLYGGAYYW